MSDQALKAPKVLRTRHVSRDPSETPVVHCEDPNDSEDGSHGSTPKARKDKGPQARSRTRVAFNIRGRTYIPGQDSDSDEDCGMSGSKTTFSDSRATLTTPRSKRSHRGFKFHDPQSRAPEDQTNQGADAGATQQQVVTVYDGALQRSESVSHTSPGETLIPTPMDHRAPSHSLPLARQPYRQVDEPSPAIGLLRRPHWASSLVQWRQSRETAHASRVSDGRPSSSGDDRLEVISASDPYLTYLSVSGLRTGHSQTPTSLCLVAV